MAVTSVLSRRSLLARGAGVAALSLLAPACAPREPVMIDLLTFPGSYNLLVWAAEAQGFFAEEGLAMRRSAPRTSMELAQGVNSGRFPIGAAAIDNVVAYNEGQGAVALEGPSRLVSFMNVQADLVLPLFVTPDIGTIADLRGRTLAVDAVSTGFSFVLREILRVHGLSGGDYELVSVGNAAARLETLIAGTHAGSLLTAPFDARAAAAGLVQIASSRDVFDAYQGTTFLTSRDWAAAHESELVAFTRALLRSFAWIGDGANRAAAATVLMKHVEGLDRPQAEAAVESLAGTLTPDFNMKGIETVLALRSRYGRPQKTLDDPGAYIDTRYLEAARAALSEGW